MGGWVGGWNELLNARGGWVGGCVTYLWGTEDHPFVSIDPGALGLGYVAHDDCSGFFGETHGLWVGGWAGGWVSG